LEKFFTGRRKKEMKDYIILAAADAVATPAAAAAPAAAPAAAAPAAAPAASAPAAAPAAEAQQTATQAVVEQPAADAQQSAPQAQGGFGMFLPMIIIFAIFYFMMIRPQQRKEKERRKMIDELRAGATVVFAGGFIGKIVESSEKTFKIELAPGVNVEVARSSVQNVVSTADGKTV
jgi:preprotein translocase subunit YajC